MIGTLAIVIAAVTSLGTTMRPPSFPAIAWPSLAPAAPGEAVYDPGAKAVSSWRAETRRTLEPAPLAIGAALFASGRPLVTRCVKLNNPWCIKRARWTGEIGADDEDHTAFASTQVAADAAAALLRTYYVAQGRRSALDIVRRWAPAECGIGSGAGLPAVLAVRGLANTLRARFLAGRGRTGTAQPRPRHVAAGGTTGARTSRVALARLPTVRAPAIAAGMGERPKIISARGPLRRPAVAARDAKPLRIASLPGPAIPPLPPVSLCGSAEGRIQYYGLAIARALGVAPSDDLKLFDEGGLPSENLLPVLVAMSAVELGYLHAGPELVEGAVGRLRARLVAAAATSANLPQGTAPPP